MKTFSKLTTRKRKTIDETPFDRYKTPPKQNLLLMPLIWLYCKLVTAKYHLKISKTNMKGLKPPFIVFGSHHSFMDFYVTPLALFPYRANYISELEGFEYFGEWIYRQIGCLGTRKFINDMALVKNIHKVTKRNGIIVIYPEARYANVGTSSELPPANGKLAKMLNVPVVAINMHGNYLQSPIWNLKKRKQARLEAHIEQLFTKEQLQEATVDEINSRLAEFLTYDEYQWQYDNKLKIDCDYRAEGLHKALYRCVSCNCDFSMNSKGNTLFCEKCGAHFSMDEFGRLSESNREFRFSHVPDWYEWQRECVISEIDRGDYLLDCKVRIEALPNAKNFIHMGEGRLIHNNDGFTLTIQEEDNSSTTLFFSSASAFSIHTEYDYRGEGQCVTLSTLDNTYFLFPLEEGFNATKIQFATEYLYQKTLKR